MKKKENGICIRIKFLKAAQVFENKTVQKSCIVEKLKIKIESFIAMLSV